MDFKEVLISCIHESHSQALVQAVNAILQPNQEALLQALLRLRLSIQDITKTLGQMHSKMPPMLLNNPPGVLGSAWGRGTWRPDMS